MNTEVHTRRRVFKRARPMPIKTTPDDVSMCHLLWHYHYAPTSWFYKLLPHRAPAKVRNRLRTLYDNGYVDRPRAQTDHHVPGKRPETIHALGNRGAVLLAQTHGFNAPKSNWTDKNRIVGRPHIQHTLSVSAIRFAADQLPKQQTDVSVIPADQIIMAAPQATRNDPIPWAWHASLGGLTAGAEVVTTIPDHFFGLDFTDLRQRFYFFCEADQNTMPVVRTNRKQTSIVRKFEAYLAGHKSGYHARRYGIRNMRFLFVTTSQTRIDTMIAALRKLANDTDTSMFLFADRNSISTATNLLEVPWRTGHDQSITLNPHTLEGVSV